MTLPPDKEQEVLDNACKIAGLSHFIKTLPDGYETRLDERASISDGQRQLLTIARAMIKNAPLLILDEATSSVDTRTEVLVKKAMDTLACGRTSFIIAHRLSTIKNADLILVMRNGDIVEKGTHEELMAAGGFYAELASSK
jgi:ATP-binding cassette subfamily B protein